MPVIAIRTEIHAPIEVCFDLARNIDVHVTSTSGTNEKAVAGVTSGLVSYGDEVTWEATHLFVRQRLTSRITAFDRPHHFRDSQVQGAFQRFDHDHFFSTQGGITVMLDVFTYEAPYGWLGKLAEGLFLTAYMRRFLQKRADSLKAHAEAGSSSSCVP